MLYTKWKNLKTRFYTVFNKLSDLVSIQQSFFWNWKSLFFRFSKFQKKSFRILYIPFFIYYSTCIIVGGLKLRGVVKYYWENSRLYSKGMSSNKLERGKEFRHFLQLTSNSVHCYKDDISCTLERNQSIYPYCSTLGKL